MWDRVVWGALIAGGVAAIGAFAVLASRALEGWRTLKEARRHATAALGEFAAKAEHTAEKVAATADTAELQGSVARLRVSLARLAVLQAALDEARS